jgi:hypothetical protein
VDEHATNFQQRLRDLDCDGEVVVLNNILTRGYDQGCFLRPKDEDLIPNTPAVTDAVLSTLDDRDIGAHAVRSLPEERAAELAARTLAFLTPRASRISPRC